MISPGLNVSWQNGRAKDATQTDGFCRRFAGDSRWDWLSNISCIFITYAKRAAFYLKVLHVLVPRGCVCSWHTCTPTFSWRCAGFKRVMAFPTWVVSRIFKFDSNPAKELHRLWSTQGFPNFLKWICHIFRSTSNMENPLEMFELQDIFYWNIIILLNK